MYWEQGTFSTAIPSRWHNIILEVERGCKICKNTDYKINKNKAIQPSPKKNHF